MTRVGKVSKYEWVQDQIKQFTSVSTRYKKYARVLNEVLNQAVKKYAPLAIVQTRPKSIASFAEKIQRKKAEFNDPIHQFTDLCGARVITHTRSQVEAVCGFVKTHFEIDWDNSVDVTERLKPTEFGYRSVHYIISFKPGVFPTRDVNVMPTKDVFPDKECPMKAEIQIRTILEHAWADISHDLSYKSAFKVPEKWQREMARASAILESCDSEFGRIQTGLERYAANYGAYMEKEKVRDEISKLEIVLEYDPENAQLADRIAKLAMVMGDWKRVIKILSRYVAKNPLDTKYPPVLRDIGVAICKKYKVNWKNRKYRQGQIYLSSACALAKDDVDAIASLAGTWKGIDNNKALDLYRQAFDIDPSNPYPLGNYLEYEIIHHRSVAIVPLMASVIRDAMLRCRDQASVNMNIPWALYNLGKFYLFLKEPYHSLIAYAKAVQVSLSPSPIESALQSVQNLQEAIDGSLPGLEWLRRFLISARATKLLIAQTSITELAETKRNIQKVMKEFARTPNLVTKKAPLIKGPVVIVGGGTSRAIDKKISGYRNLMFEAFRDFRGTIISGGTSVGIPGLVGEISKKYRSSIHTIGYLPKPPLPGDAPVDKRYSEIRRTAGQGFSPLEPLQNWIDLIASGIDPRQVKVLGISGGLISAVEYRIALALGAQVAILQESGREAAKLLSDDDWTTTRNLLRLPADPMTVRAFIGSGMPRLSSDIRLTLAEGIHEEYRRNQMKEFHTKQVNLSDWDNLPENLKESNAQQADNIFEKLRQIDCEVKEVKDREITLMTFTKREVEVMAAIEHGRWNVERIRDGWRLGTEKDVNKKISPYLIDWDALPENIKEWDRQAVRAIPGLLAKLGLEVRRKGKSSN